MSNLIGWELRKHALNNLRTMLPILLARNTDLHLDTARANVDRAVNRAILAGDELERRTNIYNMAENGVQFLISEALKGTDYDTTLDDALGQGRR